jgi:hypothetical protein
MITLTNKVLLHDNNGNLTTALKPNTDFILGPLEVAKIETTLPGSLKMTKEIMDLIRIGVGEINLILFTVEQESEQTWIVVGNVLNKNVSIPTDYVLIKDIHIENKLRNFI